MAMKTQRRMVRWATAFILTTVALPWVNPHPALAKESSGASFLDGQVVNVGSGKPNGVLHLRGRTQAAGDLDLSAVKLHLLSFLSESKGSLELVSAAGGSPLVPLHLAAKKGGSATEAVFESESAPSGPKIRIVIARVPNTDEYEFSLQVERVLIAADPACLGPEGTTERRTRLSLTDGVHSPVRLQVRHLWQCEKNQLKNPSPVAPVLGGGVPATPEEALGNMAFSLAESIAGAAVTSTLFPYPTIDYALLIEDFEEVVKEALDENDISQDSDTIDGILRQLNKLEGDYATGTSACETLKDNGGVEDQISSINIFIGKFEDYGQAGLSGWVSAAQALLSALQFQQRLKNDPSILSCTQFDLVSNSDLAKYLDEFVQYLVAQRNAILHQNILGSLHYCTNYTANCGNNDNGGCWLFHNCTGYTHDGYYHQKSCEIDALAAENTACAETTFADQTNDTSGDDGNVAWMDEVIDSWRDALAALASPDSNGQPQLPPSALPCATCQDAHAAITVDSMFTGVYDAVPVETTWWVKAACDGKQSCDYQLQPANFVQSSSEVHSVRVTYHCGDDPTPHIASLADVGSPALALYDGAYLHLDCAPRITNFQASVKGQPTSASDADVSTHAFLDAGKITDGILPPDESSAGSTTNVIVLPHTGNAGALVIDLGAAVHICGNGWDCIGEPQIQADNDDVYQLDYLSSDGVTWIKYGQFPTKSGSGLWTRTFNCNTRPNLSQPCSATNHGPNFTARYVRVFGVPGTGGATFSVSELKLWNTGSQLVSVGKPAASNFVPLITNGTFAAPATTWNNSTYATVLAERGPASGLAIDLGQVYGALDRVKVQADGNDVYQVDVSTDGATWFSWYSVPPVSAGGLQTRDSGPLPPSAGRFVRVYATHGDGSYSVSEVQVFANQSAPTCNGERVCGHSAATVLKNSPGATAQDVTVSWTCGSDPTPYTAHAAPWTVSRSSVSYPDLAVVQPSCPPTTVTCTDPQLHPTTCSHFAEDAEDDVVYTNAAHIPYQLSNDHPQCESTISGKTNFYRTNSGTKNDPACTNVQRAIHDAIAEGSCPPGIGGANEGKTWPYNVGIGGGSTATSLVDPALGQPPLLLFLGCNSLLQ